MRDRLRRFYKSLFPDKISGTVVELQTSAYSRPRVVGEMASVRDDYLSVDGVIKTSQDETVRIKGDVQYYTEYSKLRDLVQPSLPPNFKVGDFIIGKGWRQNSKSFVLKGLDTVFYKR